MISICSSSLKFSANNSSNLSKCFKLCTRYHNKINVFDGKAHQYNAKFSTSSKVNSSSAFKAAIAAGEKLIEPTVRLNDPLSIVSHEMSHLAKNIASLIGSGHSTLNKVAAYYFESDGKKLRPLIVLLISRCLSVIDESERTRLNPDYMDSYDQPSYKGTNSSILTITKGDVNTSLSPLNILHGMNPKLILDPLSKPLNQLPNIDQSSNLGILPKQRRLAEIIELIHTASLLHDDVIDFSDSRRGRPSGNYAFSNKMAVLAGDFLLARASVALARIRNPEVIELISTAIANLVEGEFMQLKNTVLNKNENMLDSGKYLPPQKYDKVPVKLQNHGVQIPNENLNLDHRDNILAAFEYYLHKSYLKTASLMSKSCRASAVLSGVNEKLIDHCYEFGRNLGLCFQIVDDVLDYTIAADQLGKPAGADLKLGLATAPVLYAWQEEPALGKLIARKFNQPGDIERAIESVMRHNGIEKSKQLAEKYRNLALENLKKLPESESRYALEFITNSVLTRTK
ncbi:trans-hexaprenyltranstransferase [Ascoidea rubescens DSM 1968]|uniref:Terpenoid synthase n=1 Tax=Ascoidea rubescens DSM 1968 TaxID=1344418 RepID=A0A1D2VHM1_9ASCO|nr:terpenoid synthase [Ascoidea rubescens DSM 1968]ODV61148.1 terpenoid synthase [Ascoidea rubescens DSM 1968]